MAFENRKVLFIVNKYSGKGFQSKTEGQILDVCGDRDVECTIEFTKAPGHATQLAQQGLDNQFAAIVAVGGDGTVNEIARSLMATKIPLGIIPKGSGNGLARHLGIPMDIKQATETLFDGKILTIDTFTVNNRLSLNVSGIGFDGFIANHFGKNGKRGLAGYTKLVLEEYRRFSEFEASLTIKGKEIQKKPFIIAIANSSQYGNNARVAPHASVCDQKLHVNIIRKIPAYRLDIILDLFRGTIDRTSFSEILETDLLQIRTMKPVPYHVDGEPCGEDKNFSIQLLPSSLTILLPDSKDYQV